MEVTPGTLMPTDAGVSWRSIVYGLCLAFVISLVVNGNLYLVHSSLLAYSHMPMGNLILTVLSIVLCSALAYRFGRAFVFSRSEWLAVFSLGFVGSLGPTYGITGQLVGALVAPYYFATPENRWTEFLHPYLPNWLFPPNTGGAMSWFFNGVPSGGSLPWEVWAGPLFWWFTFVAAVAFACFCASVILHRQWSEYERLVYPAMEPIVEIADQAGDGERWLPHFMKGKAFWGGFGIAGGIYGWNILSWFDPAIPSIQMTPGWYIPLARDFPSLYVSVNTFAICFAYFASLEVLFSLWFFDLIFIVESGILTRLGLPSWQSYHSSGVYTWQTTGAYVCLCVFWVVICRRHLKDAFLKAWDPSRNDIDDSRELMTYRTAFVGLAAGCVYAAAWLWQAGMALPVVLMLMPAMLLVYFGAAKILADSGLVFLSTPTSAGNLTVAALGGAKYVPPSTHALFFPTGVAHSHFKATVFTISTHINRLGDFVSGGKRRLFWGVCAAFLIGLVTSTLFVLWMGYTIGGYNFSPNWLIVMNGQRGYQGAVSSIISPLPMETREYTFFWIGAAVMAMFTFMRYRFQWWPFHPIGFALSGSALSHLTGFTIFVAWAIKSVLLRFVGPAFYRRSRPFFVGLLIGYVFVIALGVVADLIWFMPRGHMVHRY